MKLVVTNAGRDALKNAAGNGTNALTIESVVLGNGRYTPDAGQTGIREEHHRLKTIAGTVTGSRSLHVTVRDESRDRYSVFEIGLVTNTGVLFAVYSQNDVIIEKAPGSTLLLSLDIELSDIDVKQIAFGDTGFINPAATTEMQGVVELATDDEVRAAEDSRRAVTPLSMGRVLDDRFSQLGSASKHKEGDFERTGVAADLDDKLWKLITASYVAKAGGTYDGVINGQSPAHGDRGSAIPTVWWCGQEFDVKGAADAVQRNLDKVNNEAWKGINGVWNKANDAQNRCSHLEYFLQGSDNRAFVYVGDPTGEGILFKQEAGWWSWIYQNKTRMELTPEGRINFAKIAWDQVIDKHVVGSSNDTGLVRMNGAQSIADAAGKDYAASQYQARQGYDRAGEALTAIDAMRPDVARSKSLVRAGDDLKYMYIGSEDKNKGWYIAYEVGYANIYYNGERMFQLAIDKKIHDATIAVEQVTGRAEWGDNWFLDKQSGKLWQWGKVYSGGEREAVVRFPRVFRDSDYAIMSMDIGNGGGWHNSRDPQSWGVTLRKNGANNDIAGQWIAFGNA